MQILDEYYELWVNDLVDGRHTRKELGLDTSRKMFEQELRIGDELARRGAIIDSCWRCLAPEKSTLYHATRKTRYLGDHKWKCDRCGNEWDSLRLRFKGI